jgi:hypothetical protein
VRRQKPSLIGAPRGHNAPKDKMFKVHVAGYRRGLASRPMVTCKGAVRRNEKVSEILLPQHFLAGTKLAPLI